MSTVREIELLEASPEVRRVFEDIMATKGIGFVPNFWRALASHPPLLEQVWSSLKRTMAPGRLDPLTKEMIALAVSATNGCSYCVHSHTASARKLGMDDEMLGEVMAVAGLFNQTNALAEADQVEVDPEIFAVSSGS